MSAKLTQNRRIFEFMLIAIVFGIACMALGLGEHKLVVLNLFYLPVILSGYYLGRSTTCVLALLSVLAISIVTALDPAGFAAYFTPVLSGVALAFWAAVLGLAAILIGTLCDERAAVVDELHEAYVGVVEVLSRYLQGGNPKVKARSIRVAELAQAIATEMNLPRKHVDEIRVGALLYDLGNVEITARAIVKAVDSLEVGSPGGGKHTFAGMDLVHSLGTVLHGTVPLLIGQDDFSRADADFEREYGAQQTPVGVKIIRLARAFDALTAADPAQSDPAATERALSEVRKDPAVNQEESLMRALERVIRRTCRRPQTSSAAELQTV